MLELVSSDSFDQTTALAKTLNSSCILLNVLTAEPDNRSDRMFSVTLNRDRAAFPLLCAEIEEKKLGRTSKMTQAVKIGLKDKFKLDVEALIAKTNHHVAEPKRFNTEMFPTDPDECSAKLQELKILKAQQIEKLNQELEDLDEACATIDVVRKLKLQAEQFVMSLLDSVPHPSDAEVARAAKRQRSD